MNGYILGTSPVYTGLGITSQHGFPDLRRRALVDASQTVQVSSDESTRLTVSPHPRLSSSPVLNCIV